MAKATKKQLKELDRLNEAVEAQRVAFLAAYDQERAAQGVAVKMTGRPIAKIYDDLVALKAQRNALLEQLRDSGVII